MQDRDLATPCCTSDALMSGTRQCGSRAGLLAETSSQECKTSSVAPVVRLGRHLCRAVIL